MPGTTVRSEVRSENADEQGLLHGEASAGQTQGAGMLAAAAGALGPGVLQRKLSRRIAQRHGADVRVGPAEASEPAPAASTAPGPGRVVQRYRDYHAVAASSRGGNGADYKLIQQGSHHIKLHPLEGPFNGQVFNEFHVTFELFDEDRQCPKIYFTDAGARIDGHDDDRVNKQYRTQHAGRGGKPSFEDLIEQARKIAQNFVASLPKHLDENAALELVEERRQQEQQRQERANEEQQRLGGARQEMDERHEKSVGTAYKKETFQSIFGQNSNLGQEDERDQVLKRAGLEGHKDRRYIKNSLWSKPKESWKGLEAEYDRVEQARLELAKEKEPPKSEPQATTEPNTNAPPKQEPSSEQIVKAKQEIEEKKSTLGNVETVKEQLRALPPTQRENPTALARQNLPPWLIPLVVVLGAMMLFRLLF